jgi:hypothetical protein
LTPNISVLIYTAREDYPYLGRPEMHCFQPVLETLSAQTFRYFELVIVDALYETRSDYFDGYHSFFPITHVPASPNVWHQRGRPGLCEQLNRGLAWCDGELVWIGAENNLYPPHFLQAAWEVHFYKKKVPVAWYAILGTSERDRPSQLHPVVQFDMCGWTERLISDVDHRATRFVEQPKLALSQCHHQNHFAYAGLPLELAYELNGFDESMDGDLSGLDVDMGSRIEMLRGDDAIAMHRDLWLIEPPTVFSWTPSIQRRQPLKCNYALWWHNRLQRRTRVNVPRAPGWVEDVKSRVCRGVCEIKDKCSSGDPTVGERVMYPFCEGQDREATEFWKANQTVRNLASDADTRRRREPPFDRFTRSSI